MSKNIKEFLHYYIGQKFSWANTNYGEPLWSPWDVLTLSELKNISDFATSNISIRLALRKLEDMTEEEMKEYVKGYVDESDHDKIYDLSTDGESIRFVCGITSEWQPDGVAVPVPDVRNITLYEFTPHEFHKLLRKGFDLWGLIDAGLAIDAKTITQ